MIRQIKKQLLQRKNWQTVRKRKGGAGSAEQEEEIERLKKALKKMTDHRDELQEDFDGLNHDFQLVREDKEKAEKKSREASEDTSSILMTIDGLRSVGRVAFDGIRQIETAIFDC